MGFSQGNFLRSEKVELNVQTIEYFVSKEQGFLTRPKKSK